MNIHEMVRAAMKTHELQPVDLARKLSISEGYMIDILAGRCSISVYIAVRLEQTLGLDAESLLLSQAKSEIAKARREFAR